MSSSFTGNTNNFLPTTHIIPDDVEQKDLKLREYLNAIAQATNSKDSGVYDFGESITGQRFLPTFSTTGSSSANYRDVFRTVLDFGALPNNTSKTLAHGIDVTSNVSITRFYGGATDPGSSLIPLPFASLILANNISLEADATNVTITTGSNRTNFTRTYIVLEYMKVV